MGRTVVIGLDGIDWKLLQEFVDEGVTPNIAEVYESGFNGDLRSIDPPVSVPAWISFFTGKEPDKLDLYYFMVKEEGGNEIDRDHRLGEHNPDAFWNRLEDAGVIGVPSSVPTEDLDGFLVSGPFAPHESSEEVQGLVEEFDYDPYLPNMWQFKKSLKKLRNEADFADAVLDEKDPEFFMFTTSVTDRLQHSFWDDEEKMEELYREVDNFVGRVLDHFDPEEDNVFIVSDHGFEDLEKNFYLNSWLRDEGYLTLNQGDEGSAGREDLRYAVKRFSKDVLSRLGLLEIALDVVPQRVRSQVQFSDEIWDKIDFSNTQAFAASNYVGEIYVNKEEYEGGCVPEEEFDEVRDEIIEKLKQVEDPETGEKVVEEIWRGEEIYERYDDKSPDILFYTKDMKYKVKHDLHGRVFDESVPNGSHGLNGVILGRGPDIENGEFDMHLTDVAPTLLHLMGEDVPEDMDGEVPKEIFVEGSEPDRREVRKVSEELEDLDF
ncbi:MAG: alkaline phosphatase family protein [Candidatus Nanohalobium sp.]